MFIDYNKAIPNSNKEFQEYIKSFVFYCPSAILIDKKRKKYLYISARNCSFRERGITGTLLTTLVYRVKNVIKNGTYLKVETEDDIEEYYKADRSIEKIIYKKNYNMSDVEVIFYYIRNAFAHGSFEYQTGSGIYKLESKKNDNIKARMVLKEETLKKLVRISEMDKISVERLQKKNNK